ncbi:hypothetical protein CN226_15320 [Sinorhizobium meliloti]|nr:hypothetical protein CN226_15320 [Sinorhizobium meliloti]
MADFEESNGEQNGIASRTNPSMFHACSAYAIPLPHKGGEYKRFTLCPHSRSPHTGILVETLSAPQMVSPLWAGESHLANKRLFCCGKSILGVLR